MIWILRSKDLKGVNIVIVNKLNFLKLWNRNLKNYILVIKGKCIIYVVWENRNEKYYYLCININKI